MSEPFGRFIGIDWSGAARPGSQRIFVAEARRRGDEVELRTVVRARDRSAVEAFLGGRELEPARRWEQWPRPQPLDGGPRALVGLDFAFGFPSDFEHPGLGRDWSWDDLGRLCERLDRAPSIPAAINADPVLRRQFRLPQGAGPARRYRRTERELRPRAESVFHLIGPSQVGMGSITGIAMLHRLRASGAAVWPFDADGAAQTPAVLAEVFPRRWLDAGLSKNELPSRLLQVEAWRRRGTRPSRPAELAAVSSGDALDAAAAALGLASDCVARPRPEAVPTEARRREGWIVGVPSST